MKHCWYLRLSSIPLAQTKLHSRLSDQPGLLSKLLLADVTVRILPSPRDMRDLEPTGSVISLGSPGYNRVSLFIEERLGSDGHFRNDYGSIHIGRSKPIVGIEYGFIERIYDENQSRNIFYVAGLSEAGTVGAANYLLNQYRELYAKYGRTTNFVQLLRFDADNHNRYEIIPIGIFRQQTDSTAPTISSGVVHWKDPRAPDVILSELLNKPTLPELGNSIGLGTARFVPPSGVKSDISKGKGS